MSSQIELHSRLVVRGVGRRVKVKGPRRIRRSFSRSSLGSGDRTPEIPSRAVGPKGARGVRTERRHGIAAAGAGIVPRRRRRLGGLAQARNRDHGSLRRRRGKGMHRWPTKRVRRGQGLLAETRPTARGSHRIRLLRRRQGFEGRDRRLDWTRVAAGRRSDGTSARRSAARGGSCRRRRFHCGTLDRARPGREGPGRLAGTKQRVVHQSTDLVFRHEGLRLLLRRVLDGAGGRRRIEAAVQVGIVNGGAGFEAPGGGHSARRIVRAP
mmetsp:Transcript_20278/g.47528  ORF Transcript_20278/g.47528 Transcript_20278/m.47528 type:complete len:267 (-) Transcript_20278:31-831(-)